MRAIRSLIVLGAASLGLGACVAYPDGTLGPAPAYVAPAPYIAPAPVYVPPPVVVAPRPYYWGPRPYRPHYYRRW